MPRRSNHADPTIQAPSRGLPREVWLIILNFAACIPAAEAELAPPYATPAVSTSFQSAQIGRSMRASARSCALRLVCHKWRDLLSPLFWKHIRIPNDETIASAFRDTLERSARQSGESVGRHIQELTLRLFVSKLRDLGRIIGCCPRLKSLTIYLCSHWKAASILTHLTLPHTLLHLNIHATGECGEHALLQAVAETLTRANTRSLKLESGYRVAMPRHLHLPTIEALHLPIVPEGALAATVQWEMPSLTKMVIGRLPDTAEAITLFQHLGPQLSSLEIGGTSGASPLGLWNPIKSLHNLVELVIPAGRLSEWLQAALADSRGEFHSSVAYVGITGPPEHGQVDLILGQVLAVRWQVLRIVRVMLDGASTKSLRETVASFGERYRQAGIRVEDGRGRDLLPLPRSSSDSI